MIRNLYNLKKIIQSSEGLISLFIFFPLRSSTRKLGYLSLSYVDEFWLDPPKYIEIQELVNEVNIDRGGYYTND